MKANAVTSNQEKEYYFLIPFDKLPPSLTDFASAFTEVTANRKATTVRKLWVTSPASFWRAATDKQDLRLSLFCIILFFMDTIAYWLALITVIMVPPFMLMWYVVHPFAGFWRRVGPVRTYASLILLILPAMGLLYSMRAPLLRVHYGVNWLLMILAVQIFAVSMLIGIVRLKHLKPYILLGLPEIRGEGEPEKLLTDGVYSLIRHPRYAEVWLGLLAIALFTNYLALYMLVVMFIPLIYGVVLLEEKELRERFGEKYEMYCAEVPRFFPKKR